MDDGRHLAQVLAARQVHADEGHAHAIQLPLTALIRLSPRTVA